MPVLKGVIQNLFFLNPYKNPNKTGKVKFSKNTEK